MPNDANSIAERPEPSRTSRLIRLALAAALVAAAVFALLRFQPTGGVPAAIGAKRRTVTHTATAIVRSTPSVTSALPSDDDLSQRLIGTWADDYQGKRTLTVRPDGTATMNITFDGWKARLFTPRLQIETTWTVEAGCFNRQTIGGEPADKVEFVKNRVGDQASDRIVNVTPDRMVLIDQDGETRYDWRRVR